METRKIPKKPLKLLTLINQKQEEARLLRREIYELEKEWSMLRDTCQHEYKHKISHFDYHEGVCKKCGDTEFF